MNRPITLVTTGLANIASVRAAFDRIGFAVRQAESSRDITEAARLIMPGVGAFGPAMAELERRGWVSALRSRLNKDRPTLAICLGHQLLGALSDEAPGVDGLSVVSAGVHAFEAGVISPQMGWNRVSPSPGCKLLEGGDAYFANSFRFSSIPSGWCGATSHYGGQFVAALERGNVLSCQFHPELSGEYGESLLRRWIDATEAAC